MNSHTRSRTAKLFLAALSLLLFISLIVVSSQFVRKPTRAVTVTSLALARLPPVFLWAWERPEKLDFIDPQTVGVAFLAKTISLRGDRTVVRHRLQPLHVPLHTKMIAVARIESDRSQRPILSSAQRETSVSELAALARLPDVVAIQVDFDAILSERDFYRSTLVRLREELPPSVPLSITALASWCLRDDWLSDLPIDEAVPMLFRMGIDRKQILSRLASGATFNSTPCQNSAGVSTDESVSFELNATRLYIFSPEPWSPVSLKTAMESYHR